MPSETSGPSHNITAREQAEIRRELAPLDSRDALIHEVLDALKSGCRIITSSDSKTGLLSFQISQGEELFTVAKLPKQGLEIIHRSDVRDREAPPRQDIELFENNVPVGAIKNYQSKDSERP